MSSGNRNVVKEALADAQALREAAMDVAKQKIVEGLTPAIRNLVDKTLGSSMNEDSDRLRRAADGYGETEFEEGKDFEGVKDMDDKDKDLENESLDSMFPGISEVEELGDEDEDGKGDLEGLGDEDDQHEMAGYGAGIPTLGEGEEEEEEEGDMDEEISIDEEGLRKAYESILKADAALAEASVSSGFKDSYPGSEWETEDSPPSDRGLEKKEKQNAEWDKERAPASQDYTVKEAIEKGLRENGELRRYVQFLEGKVQESTKVIKNLQSKIHEVNLFNQKVVHVNEMFHKYGKNLTKEQKSTVIKKIDEASTVREVKLVAETFKGIFDSHNSLHEGVSRKPKANAQRRMTSGSPDQKVLRESVDKGPRNQYARMMELAGIVGSK